MVRLTKYMITAKTKRSDLKQIKKFVCCRADLHDVSIVKTMSTIEIIALNYNRIRSLKPFSHCKNLRELYLGNNQIKNIGEIIHLKNLQLLRHLWLSNNPCCRKAGASYRAIVLRALPKLKTLDNIKVSPKDTPEETVTTIDIHTSESALPSNFSIKATNSTTCNNEVEYSRIPHQGIKNKTRPKKVLSNSMFAVSKDTSINFRGYTSAESINNNCRRVDSQSNCPSKINSASSNNQTSRRVSNLLSATLSLTKELDSSSLVVLDCIIRTRINELAADCY